MRCAHRGGRWCGSSGGSRRTCFVLMARHADAMLAAPLTTRTPRVVHRLIPVLALLVAASFTGCAGNRVAHGNVPDDTQRAAARSV